VAQVLAGETKLDAAFAPGVVEPKELRREPGIFPPKNKSGCASAERLRSWIAYEAKKKKNAHRKYINLSVIGCSCERFERTCFSDSLTLHCPGSTFSLEF
jgi:hypothetical protein